MHQTEEPGPVRVKVHPGLCNGWGQCSRFAPEVFQLDDAGYVDLVVVEVPGELAEAARRGAAACPEQAITIIEIPKAVAVASPDGISSVD